MKDSLNYIEIMVLVRELKKLEGARLENVYHPKKEELVLNFYKNGKYVLKMYVPKFICLTEYKQENPLTPSHFSMFLRKYLRNSRLESISQVDMERVVEFKFRKGDEVYFLMCELFSKGNIILCDKNRDILIPLLSQSWRDRIIRPHRKYQLPPKRFKFDELDFEKFKEIIFSSNADSLVKSLATSLAIGGTYAEELCVMSSVDKNKTISEIPNEELRIIFDNFNRIIERARYGNIEANVIFAQDRPIDVQPFLLQIYSSNEKRIFSSYNEALDYFFANYSVNKEINQIESKVLKEIIKQEMILKQHKDYLKKLKDTSETYRKQAEYIYAHLGEIEDIFTALHNARDHDVSWDEIISKLNSKKQEGNHEAKLIKKIIPEDGILVLDFEPEIKLDFTLSATENANNFYEKAKKMQSKLDGVSKAITDVEDKIMKLRESKEIESVTSPKKIIKRDKEWYEKFNWFFTSNGKLAIGGKDATQNEILIKKYLEQDDIVFHADVYGSPFVIVKNGKESTDEERKEVAIFTLCHSRAWQNKRIESVYWIYPHQVSKKAPSGEYIGKGAFMIYGKKNYIKDVELRYAVGIQFEPFKIISGPVENVRRKAKYYAVLIPGDKSKEEISKQIKQFLISVSREADKEVLKNISSEDIKEHVLKDSKIFGVTR